MDVMELVCIMRRQQINLAVLSMKESGTLMQLQNKWWEDRSECPIEEKEAEDTDDELSLQSLSGIFYILGGGLGVAILLALLDFCWSTTKEARKRKVRPLNTATVKPMPTEFD